MSALVSARGKPLPRPVLWTVAAALTIGTLMRLSGFLGTDRLFQQFPTEDGYLMLTIARNLAIGNGFSVGDGQIPTNGTQPFMTLVFTLGFLVGGGDRVIGVAFAEGLLVLTSIATAIAIFWLGCRISSDDRAPAIAAIAASTWYVSGITIPHSMNGLETGPYALIAALVGLVFIEDASPRLWSWPRTLGVGVLLGFAFLIRNDACFLILAACLTHLYVGWETDSIGPRFARVMVFGSTSVVVASPWLVFNYLQFGHIMPVSGRAESLTAGFADNLALIFFPIAEYFTGVLAIPESLESRLTILVIVFVTLAVGAVLYSFRRASPEARRLIVLSMIFGTCLFLFYGLFFGAGWFVYRYTFPLTPFIFLFWSFALFWLLDRLGERLGAWVPIAVAVPIVLAVGAMNYRIWARGTDHMHFQVVEWVRDNVPPQDWVGAPQTGTVGFFHDRTINLDGKVNPAAYEALLDRRLPTYIVHETPIEWIADWEGMAAWVEDEPIIGEHFEVVVHDVERNLAVLHRTTPAPMQNIRR
jgi:hypothetical protein